MFYFVVIRKQHGWSQAELARQTGMHSSTVSRIESGRLRPYLGQIRNIAAALNIAEDEVMGEVRHDGSSVTE